MQNENTLAARTVLLRYMEYCSEERWSTGWLGDLEYALARQGDELDSGAFRWFVEEAGGWWTWRPGDVMREFIEGSYAELEQHALAGGTPAPHLGRPAQTGAGADPRSADVRGAAAPPLDPSWEAVGWRLWRGRYKLAQFLAIVVGLDALSIWLKWSENTAMLVGAPVAVLVLVPDPPLWRMPLRSSRHSPSEPPTPGEARREPNQLSPK